jgi:hypothetical protein
MSITRKERLEQLIIKASARNPQAAGLFKRAALLAPRIRFIDAAPDIYKGNEEIERLVAIATSQSGGPDHLIKTNEKLGIFTCTCDYFQKAGRKRPLTSRGQPLCSHIAAFSLADKLNADMKKIATAQARPSFADEQQARWSAAKKAVRASEEETRQNNAWRADEIRGVPEAERRGTKPSRIRRRMPASKPTPDSAPDQSLEETNALLFD